ncbi:MAG: cupin domain-containing protein, partial [Pseudomonadota bacterium]
MSDNSIPPASGQPYISADQIEAVPETHICHPFNENSDAFVRPLSFAAGLKRLRISITRIPPGKESFIYHAHARDEEFLYILEGRGRAEIGDEVVEVGPGDFMGFPTPSVAHHLINPYDKDLVYLMGGEHSGFDVGTF